MIGGPHDPTHDPTRVVEPATPQTAHRAHGPGRFRSSATPRTTPRTPRAQYPTLSPPFMGGERGLAGVTFDPKTPERPPAVPPAPKIVHLAQAARARRRPGVWIELEKVRTSRRLAWNKAASIRSGRAAAFRPGGAFEARVAGRTLFVRYVGPPSEPVAPSPSARPVITVRNPR